LSVSIASCEVDCYLLLTTGCEGKHPHPHIKWRMLLT